jgi:vacuolar protein sorting-associated protein 13A/C
MDFGFLLYFLRILHCHSGKLSWEQLLRFASLQKRYISIYASLLKSDLNRAVVDDNKEIEELDRGLDIDLILQWRYIFWP